MAITDNNNGNNIQKTAINASEIKHSEYIREVQADRDEENPDSKDMKL